VQAAGSGAVLELSRGAVPAVVDLAAEGGRDWMHWAEDSAFSTERRRGGGFAILEGTPVAPRERHTGSPERFRWTGGTPVGSSGGSRSGVRTCGAGSAFTVSAPAGRASRTLRLYVGAWQAEGVLTARLSTGGTAVTGVLDSPGAGPGGTAVFTLTYQAPRDGRLELTWSTGRTYAGGCAGVALQAATLR
jgi:hypothetical protein